MSAIAVMLIKVGFLALLWLFILLCASVVRSDIFGRRVPAAAVARSDGSDGAALPARPATPSRRQLRGQNLRRVVITSGPQEGISADLLEGEVRIGRSADCQLLLDDDYVSTRHARLVAQGDGQFYLEDHHSTNGTYVNNQRITGSVFVGPDDTIRIGRTQMKLSA